MNYTGYPRSPLRVEVTIKPDKHWVFQELIPSWQRHRRCTGSNTKLFDQAQAKPNHKKDLPRQVGLTLGKESSRNSPCSQQLHSHQPFSHDNTLDKRQLHLIHHADDRFCVWTPSRNDMMLLHQHGFKITCLRERSNLVTGAFGDLRLSLST